MSSPTIPMDTLVPISRFGRGTASAEFAKVGDNHPVTVLRNNEPVYFIINEHDFRRFHDLEEEVKSLRNAEARRQAESHEYSHEFDNTDQLREYFDAL
ncbi:type II toxin-antitoxin system Phd/YefM family antitoxin [Bifidobacterium callimiconis]|uniref:Type II toxin-antitoxin system n=1 Tax=Bifidobacterium callimiconis TaxID=2306973 RepID=A0A430F7S0_9BIFI|nr:type II toxin-antitoxin system Phd/YefM family antitoxin [Bifidobacterium callimiconis]MBT1177538.1 type II toxin-antitoxin system Phd/YefM family antitoxin [Bifidobacterium callimiconis]RSX48969.1 type II toxin-antitoxin system [Bifidobacterium callimiconis]